MKLKGRKNVLDARWWRRAMGAAISSRREEARDEDFTAPADVGVGLADHLYRRLVGRHCPRQHATKRESLDGL